MVRRHNHKKVTTAFQKVSSLSCDSILVNIALKNIMALAVICLFQLDKCQRVCACS